MRDIIDFAAMSEDLAHELNNLKTGLPDLGSVVVGQAVVGGVLHECSATPCAANDVDGK
tara:strand:- start:306 stop:482 length:177 start_codon:yes stop_codon:yes gene_type:complete